MSTPHLVIQIIKEAQGHSYVTLVFCFLLFFSFHLNRECEAVKNTNATTRTV